MSEIFGGMNQKTPVRLKTNFRNSVFFSKRPFITQDEGLRGEKRYTWGARSKFQTKEKGRFSRLHRRRRSRRRPSPEDAVGRARARMRSVSTRTIERRRLRGRWRDGKAHVLLRMRTGLLQTQHQVECPTREQGRCRLARADFGALTPDRRRRILRRRSALTRATGACRLCTCTRTIYAGPRRDGYCSRRE